MDMLGMSGWCCQRQCFVFRNVSLSPLYPLAQRILLQHLELVLDAMAMAAAERQIR